MVDNRTKDFIDEDEILKLASIASRPGQSLTGLIGTRKPKGPVPPVITMGRIPIEALQDIRVMDAPINIEGVPSEESSERLAQMISDHMATKCKEAMDEHGRE